MLACEPRQLGTPLLYTWLPHTLLPLHGIAPHQPSGPPHSNPTWLPRLPTHNCLPSLIFKLCSYLDDMTPERVDAGGIANVAAAAAKHLQVHATGSSYA